jgi:predicted GNAT superfamily acetyltransferase
VKIIYRELNSENDYCQCIELQKQIFDFSDIEVISHHFLKLIARNNPPIGISLGVFSLDNEKETLVGFVIGMASMHERSLYVVLMGMKPDFQNSMYGFKMMLKFREISLARNIDKIYGAIDPLDSNIARFDIGCLGFTAYKYESDKNSKIKKVPNDKLLIQWNLNDESVKERLNGNRRFDSKVVINSFPIATTNYLPEEQIILIELPENNKDLLNTDLEKITCWHESIRFLLTTYVNEKQYIISDCCSIKVDKHRKSYYLLEIQ